MEGKERSGDVFTQVVWKQSEISSEGVPGLLCHVVAMGSMSGDEWVSSRGGEKQGDL